ncbi:MAG: biotin--[acetyl-CoA-carboxylase] ligase [Pseudomonadota bacterium]
MCSEQWTEKLLQQLADGQDHTLEKLASRLGTSVEEIARQLEALANDGVPVEKEGVAYRLPPGTELLDEQAIRAALTPQAGSLLRELSIYFQIDSTSEELLRRGGAGAQVCLAEQQRSGRGRQGRFWVSPFGCNVYMSVSWAFSGGVRALEGLSLAVGVALTDTFEALGIDDVKLKWPNDALRGGAKLAGILVELSGDAGGTCTAVIGIGINLRMPDDDAESVTQPWADLSDHAPGRNRLVAELLNRLLPLLNDYESEGFAPWRERWVARHAWAGMTVRVLKRDGELVGRALDLDEHGALRLATESGTELIHAGEVSLRVLS